MFSERRRHKTKRNESGPQLRLAAQTANESPACNPK
jgi:hypothetical protein